ncbi:Iron transport protein YfeA [Bartonella australis AUST/NH1]|uniref:Iron transport protein YfeA n=1 Tax=Bartonella australis (strain Aust/NH1) TaxID=1094489 RepID=M1NRP5_BARAA|nr:metal ABC transporter substrate-binding protein [Bartonella australis]AGF73983.1 Iron transport protein YfeA [Bartonella australis AUST/NH1]
MGIKAFFIVILGSLIFGIPSSVLSASKFKAVTTFTIIADMARNVAGDVADVESITKPGAEIHEYQPTPRDLMRAQGADLILWNGLELELWFEKFFQNIKDVPSVIVSKGVVPIEIGDGPFSGKPNPHAWMSPTAALIYVNNIRDAFIQYDPEHAATYKENAEIYKRKIRSNIEPIKSKLGALPENKRWLVTSEGAFSYLARDFGLKELYLWPINADQQGTPQQVKYVIDMVRKYGIQAVFSESTISAAPAKQVARETGAKYGGVLYVDSLSEKNGEVPTYIDLLRVTSGRIAGALSN